MTDATSPFLNQPLRTETDARVACEQTERERQRRLEQHGAAFCRQILDGAFERIYQPDGSYRLREVATGAWLVEQPLDHVATTEAKLVTAEPSTAVSAVALSDPIILAARRYGYRAALRDVTQWISVAAIEPRMHADTLAELNVQITALSARVASVAGDVTEPGLR